MSSSSKTADILPPAAQALGGFATGRQKHTRLPLACNQCRKRKVRCDAELPQCRNCQSRGDVCETTNPRRPGAVVHRRPRRSDASTPSRRRERTPHRQGRHDSASRSRHETDEDWQEDLGASTDRAPSASVDAVVAVVTPIDESRVGTMPSPMSGVAGQSHRLSPHEPQRPLQQDVGLDKDDVSPSMMVITAEDPARQKYMGGSSVQSLCALADVYLDRIGLPPMSTNFHHGMRHCEEFKFPLRPTLPDIPPLEVLDKAVAALSERLLPLYPVIDPASLLSHAERLRRLQNCRSNNEPFPPGSTVSNLQSLLSLEDIPVLCSIYCATVIGMEEQDSTAREEGDDYLAAVYSLVGQLNAMPYLSSVQALFLLSNALRGRGKEGQAWNILGQAVRIAHSIGLHKLLLHAGARGSVSDTSRVSLRSRVWWSCYALEKQMELETGRPSSVRDLDNDQLPPNKTDSFMAGEIPDYHAVWVALARILGQISEHIFRGGSENLNRLLYETGRLDQALQSWAEALPDGLRMNHQILYFARHRKHPEHIASFLFLQYQQAQITLFRASLVLPAHSFLEAVQSLEPVPPSHSRLLCSNSICVESARSLLNQVLEMADRGVHSWIFMTSQTFLAILVLIINMLRNPRKLIVRSDGELVTIASELVQAQWRRVGQDSRFVASCDILRDTVNAVIRIHSEEVRLASVTPSDAQSRRLATARTDVSTGPESSDHMPLRPFEDGFSNDPFESMPLDELWTLMDTGSWATDCFFD